MILLLLLFPIILFFFLMNPKFGFKMLIFFIIFNLDFIGRFFIESRLLGTIPIILMFALIVPLFMSQNKKLWGQKKILVTGIIVLLIYMVLNGIFKGISIVGVLFSIRYIVFFLFLIIAINSFNVLKLDYYSFSKFIVKIALLQVPVTIIQRLYEIFIFKYVYLGSSGDLITGTFQSYFSLGFLQVIAFFIVLLHYNTYRKSIIPKFNNNVLLLLLMIPLLISNSKSVFIVIVFNFFIFLFMSKNSLKKIFINIGIIAIFAFLFVSVFIKYMITDTHKSGLYYYSMDFIMDYNFGKDFNTYNYNYGIERSIDKGKLLRGASVLYQINSISEKKVLFTGLGIGSLSPSRLFGLNVNSNYYLKNRSSIRNTIGLLIGEGGIILFFLFFMILYIYVKGIKFRSNSSIKVLSAIILFTFLFYLYYTTLFREWIIVFILAYFINVLDFEKQKKHLL